MLVTDPSQDIQSWWEVPSIAHFCSLFRVAFNLLDFDIEELEEALLTDGTEYNGSSLLQELIVRLLCGCLGHNGISTFNYQMFLRRLFRSKCKEQGRENPFNTDIDFQFLPLRTKVEILHALCDFRLDAEDVIDVLKNLDSDSLRVHPLGYDENKSAYWYFYGTRLYKEDYPKKRKKKKDHDKHKSKKKKKDCESSATEDEFDEPQLGTWSVTCYTEEDWQRLADSMAGSTSKEERALYTVLSEDFLPEIPRLFEEKERLQRKRRQSRRIELMKTQKEEQVQPKDERYTEREKVNKQRMEARKKRATRLANRRSRSNSLTSSDGDIGVGPPSTTIVGRQTNNSLSSATGQIIIQTPKQKFRSSQLRTREDLMTGLYKILDRVKEHKDAWPFKEPVREEYAPKYYSVIAKPMDLQTIEDKLDNAEYGSLQQFRGDFQLIVDNCRQYNGSENEYTEMALRLQELFEASVERFLEVEPSSEEDECPLIVRRQDDIENSMDTGHCSSSMSSRCSVRDSAPPSDLESHRSLSPDRDSSLSRESNAESEAAGEKRNFKVFRKKKKKKRFTHHNPEDPRKTDDDSDKSSLDEKGVVSRETSGDRRERVPINYKEEDTTESEDLLTDTSSGSSKYNTAKKPLKPPVKRAGVINNLAAIEALELATEETLKDINRWLDETPRFSDFSSNSNSPLHMSYSDDVASIENEYRRRLQLDRPARPRDRYSNELNRRRMFKEQMGLKRKREIQRTIDRLQPGKSKGNLLSKDHNQEVAGGEPKNPLSDDVTGAPMISLGKVLETDVLGLVIGEGGKKDSEDDCTQDKLLIEEELEEKVAEEKPKEEEVPEKVKDSPTAEVEKVEAAPPVEQKKEKPTPNLSAWFKAFGAPKAPTVIKKKVDSEEIKNDRIDKDDDYDDKKPGSPIELQSPARRQRKLSTGSSVSERSSVHDINDGNSPRPSLDDVYLSPRPESKPSAQQLINGTIKVGFYQDTCFPRGTSETGNSPRNYPESHHDPYCSPRQPHSPRDIEYRCASPRSPPRSPKSPETSPQRDYPPIVHSPLYPGVPHYPSHISYYEANKTPQYRTTDKSSGTIYPVKKRIYSEIEPPKEDIPYPERRSGSFTPTREAMEQERTFTPTPGRMPVQSQPIRVPESPLPMGLTHPLQHHLMDPYADERRMASPYYSHPSSPHPIYSQTSVAPTNYSRDADVPINYERQPESPPVYNRVLSPYPRSDSPAFPKSPTEPPKSKTPIINYSRTEPRSPESSPTTPINYSNVPAEDLRKEITSPPPKSHLSRQEEMSKMSYSKIPPEVLASKMRSSSPPLPYSSARLDMLPPKINSPYRGLPELSHTLNYSTNPEIPKLSVPLNYSNQAEIISSKVNYNHPMADLMQTTARYNYPMPDLIQSKGGVYNAAVHELMQNKSSPYQSMIPNNLSYNRPISELMQGKVPEIQREMAYSPRAVPLTKSESSKSTKKSKKKKSGSNAVSEQVSGFQQYVSPSAEPLSLKTTPGVPGSAFNFSQLKDSYASYLEDMRSPYYVAAAAAAHSEGGPASKGAPHAPPYFLGHTSARAPSYPHPFINPQYQQYLQRHPEDLLRPMVLHQGLLPPGAPYPPASYLGMHDSINRPSWL